MVVYTEEECLQKTSSITDTLKFDANVVPSPEWMYKLKDSMVKKDKQIDLAVEINNITSLTTPAQLFLKNDWAIRNDFQLITIGRLSEPISSTNKVINSEQVFIEQGARIEYSILNASTGPIYIGKDAIIMEGCMIRGPFALCKGALLKMGTKIYGGTTIGPYCIAGGEIKNTILFGYSNKSHDGYLGDSVIGEWCNIGAGTNNSNIKNTAGEVVLWNQAQKQYVGTGRKCGLLMGDYSRSAINTSFNTGTVVGISCNVFGEGFPPKYIPDFTWGRNPYKLDKALQHIDNWKKLKGSSITEKEIKLLTELYSNK